MKNEIVTELQDTIEDINTYHKDFGANDIRSSFVDGYFQILRTYYSAYYHIDSDDILIRYREIYPEVEIKRENLALHFQGHKNLLNSFLIINCWSNFELFITLLSLAVLDSNQINKLLMVDYDRLKKILAKIEIGEAVDIKLRKFIKDHIAHTPIIYKYGKLFKLIEHYPSSRNKTSDREFLDFFGKLRNCIHSNYIYYGNSIFTYTFNDEVFTLEPGKVILHEPSRDDSIFNLVKNLKEIGKVFIDGISHDKEIYDPSVQLVS
jgi:hypothetical protein